MKIVSFFIALLLMTKLFAADLVVTTGLSIPPYIIKESNSGIELDIVREALTLRGYKISNIIYATNRRVKRLLINKVVDMAINVQPNLEGIYYSDTIIEFKNVAITLKNKNITLKNIDELKGKKVLAFQNANKFLGPEFFNYASKSLDYIEIINQIAQVNHLYKNRTDVAIADKYVFLYYKNIYEKKNDKKFEVDFFDILPSSPRRAGFLTKQIRDDFNAGLKQLKRSSLFDTLIKKYNFMD